MQSGACNRAGAECITSRRPRRRRWPMMEACWRACFAENGRLPAERCSAVRSPGSRAWSSRSSSTGSAPAPHTCRHDARLRVCQRCGICRGSQVIPQLLRQVPAAHVQARLSTMDDDHDLGAVRVLDMAGSHATPPRSSSADSRLPVCACAAHLLKEDGLEINVRNSKGLIQSCVTGQPKVPLGLRMSSTPELLTLHQVLCSRSGAVQHEAACGTACRVGLEQTRACS